MFLIERLWVKPMETYGAYGYSQLGAVSSIEEANRICASAFVDKSEYPWPLKQSSEFREHDAVPLFRALKVADLDGFTAEQLKELP